MRLSEFAYELPPDLIAQHPVHPRDAARLLVLERATGRIDHRSFSDLPEYLHRGDVLVVNDTRVIPARLHARERTGGTVEVLLLRPAGDAPSERLDSWTWEALVRPGRRVRAGAMLEIAPDVTVEVIDVRPDGVRVVRLRADRPVPDILREFGDVPLPPYVHEPLEHPDDYQTIYAARAGAVAAPTAGLHFTDGLINRVETMGVAFASITLHIGLGTFRPVTSDDIAAHRMDAEWFEVGAATADAINRARRHGGRVVVVGTSAVRALETAAGAHAAIRPGSGWSTLFIYPGVSCSVTDALVTNFHLPKTTLLMLVSAFAGRDVILAAYREAVDRRYRFYSFGDAMLIF